MTTPAVPSLTTTGKRKYGKGDKRPFIVDGVPYILLRPKQAMLARAANILESPAPMSGKRMAQAAGFVSLLTDYVEIEEPDEDGSLRGRELLQQRLADPDDDLDLEEMMPLLTKLLEAWFDRPTGSPPASTRSRRTGSSTRASRARTR